jgi:hypothetical protein
MMLTTQLCKYSAKDNMPDKAGKLERNKGT